MRAIIKTSHGEGHLEFGEWPEPTPAPDEIKLKVGYAGICGTDIHIIKGEWPCRPPVVLGHEFCGSAVEVGGLVRGFKPGDRIVFQPSPDLRDVRSLPSWQPFHVRETSFCRIHDRRRLC
jgi:L-iditol 2-dehydrogenase